MGIEFFIPRLEWGEVLLSGTTTNGDETVSGLSSTDDLVVGMVAVGLGIPVGATIVSKGPTSIELSVPATASATVSMAFFQRLDFRYPPASDSEDQPKADVNITTSLSGLNQTQTNFVKAERDIEFEQLTQTERDILINKFFLEWACFGRKFRWFVDKADSVFFTYELNDFDPKHARQVKKHPEFLYRFEFSMRRVIF